MQRFDEIELDTLPLAAEIPAAPDDHSGEASRFRRLLALLTDLSLFAALTLALMPLIPAGDGSLLPSISLAGFVVVVSFHYFSGCWLLWGKTVGGAIFDVRVVAEERQMTLRQAAARWAGVILSILFGGLGFALAILPSRRSLPDLLSGTRCIASN